MSKAENKLAEELARELRVRLHLCTEGETATQIANVEASIAILLEPHLVGEWMPIESAPKDGTRILGWGKGLIYPRMVWWQPDLGWGLYTTLTVWQPLPVLPKGEQSA